MEVIRGTLGKNHLTNKKTVVKSVSPNDMDRAYQWAQDEIAKYTSGVKRRVRLIEPENFKESPDATVSLFYDRKTGVALRRTNWRDGKLRYEEVVNFNELRFEANDLVNYLLYNGVKLSNLYVALRL